MKVCHISLAGPYTDNFTYQENLLAKYHARLGLDVSLIASFYAYDDKGKLIKTEEAEYENSDGVHVLRLDIKRGDINSKFKKYDNLDIVLRIIEPDILFVHGCQFRDIKTIVDYKKTRTELKLYVDNHADYSNSGKNVLSRHILHGVIWRRYAKMIYKEADKFYGVTPSRVSFLKEVYGLKEDKLELLVMGADDEKVEEALLEENVRKYRERHSVKGEDFLIVTGGKIDQFKSQTLLLMDAVLNIPQVRLIVFGSVDDELKAEVEKRNRDNVEFIGWLEADETYKYFALADLLVFPGRHSVFWEQALGLGKVMIIKKWEGYEHLDLGGNLLYIEEDSSKEIEEKIRYILNNKDEYIKMVELASLRGKDTFSYINIAKRSLEL